jgi:type I restriction enzyme S subunit
MEKYQSYKSSGVDLIGDVPTNWIVTKFNRYVFFQEGPGLRTFQFTDEGTKVICVTNITEKGIDFTYKKFISNYEYLEKYQHFTVNKGDLLLSSSGNSWGKVSEYLEDEKVMLNTSTIRLNTLDSSRMNKVLIKYILKSEFVRTQLDILMTGSCQPNFGPSHLNQLIIPIPPIHEQHQIVQFLDKKTELIDKLISTKERKITLLKKQRISLINQVVTKGLNPNVKMKDSGVEWIGEIPECWLVTRIGFVSELLTGNPWKSDLFDFDDGLKIVRGENVSEGFFRWGDKTRYWKNEVVKGDTYLLKEGDIVISMDGSKVGKNYVLINQNDLPLLLHQRMCRVRCKDVCSSSFLNYFIGSQMFRYYIDITKTDPMIPHITQKDISNFILPLPSIDEQFEIIEYLDSKTKEIDNLVLLEQKKIDLLKEYRQSLISEVVTGKIKVTN